MVLTQNSRVVAGAIGCWRVAAEAWATPRVGPCKTRGAQSVTGTRFSSISLPFPCQFHCTAASFSDIVWEYPKAPLEAQLHRAAVSYRRNSNI